MLKLKDKNKKLVAGLINYKDLCIESTLSTGDKKLSFSLHKEDKFYNLIEEECYIETKTQEYVIKARDVGVDYTRFDCVLNLEELEANIFDRFESVEQTITSSLNLAIVGTGWTVKDNTLKKKRTVRCTNKNALEIVQEIKKTYRVDIVFNTLKREIEVYEHLGEDKGTYFIDSLNLTALQVQSDSYKFATRIIAEGKDGLTFSSINNGKNYVENFQYSKKIKTIYWKDERYTVKESLLEDAKAKLEEISKPFVSYSASILNLAKLNPKYRDILDYKLGDTITLISKNNKVKDKQRIVKILEYPQDHSRDTVELANATLKFEDIQQENQETTSTVNNITVDDGTIDGSTIDGIKVKQIEDFKANVVEVVNLKAINASIDNLHANKADIQDLHAVTAKIGTLEANKANITELNAVKANLQQAIIMKADITDLNAANGKIAILESKTASIDNLVSQKASVNDLKALNATISEALIKKATIAQLEALETKTNNLIADKANIKDLNVTNANINKIQAETANIKTLLNGNLSSENIQAGGITSDKLTIANGFITNLMISSVSASKITAGTIDAAKINVVNLNADNLTVGKINGQLLKDGSISGLAIGNGAIDNSKVAPGANIEASKININSVVTAINAGSTLLTANKIVIDLDKGTLDVAFNNLNTSLEANKKITESNSTAINVVQGKLSASIENSKVLEGKQKTLEDNYNRTASTVDSLKNTIGSHKTLIDSATGKITSVEVKANTLEKDLSGLTQTVTDTKKVIENNKTSLESKNAELKANIDKVSSSLSSVSNTVDKNNKALVSKTNTLEQTLNGLAQTVSSNKSTTDGKISNVENVTHELKAGLSGLTSKLDTLKSSTDGINKTVINQGSAINQLQDSIKLKVDSSTFNKAIENVQIGGRNFYLNSSFQNNLEKWSTNDPIIVIKDGYLIMDARNITGPYLDTQQTFNVDSEGIYTMSLDVAEANGTCYMYAIDKTDTDAVQPYTDNCFTLQSKKRNFKVIEGRKGTTRFWSVIRAMKGSYLKCRLAKFEKGNKYSDWTPAPEDVQAYADSKKNEAIKTAGLDAANKAKEALNSAKAFVNSEINTVNTHLNKNTSEINILKGKIESKVSQSDIDKSISNITIGGRNLVKKIIANNNTSLRGDEILLGSNGGDTYFKVDLYEPLITGETYTLSLNASNVGSGVDWQFGIQVQNNKYKIHINKNGRISSTFVAIKTEDMSKILIDDIVGRLGKNNIVLSKFKVEKGNKATDYTEPPEHLNQTIIDNIKTVTDKISTVESKLTQENNSIKASVRDLNSTTQSITTNVSNINRDLTNKINSNLNTAIAKATEALNNAKSYTNAQVSTVNTKVSNVESNLNVLKGKIESKVSQTDIDKSISDIQIGGRNLLPLTPRNYVSAHMNIWNWAFATRKISELGLKVGDKITFSIWSKFGNVQTGGRARISFYDIKNNNIKTVSNSDMINPNEEGFSFVTVEIPPNTETVWVGLQRGNPVGDGALEFDFLIKMPKLEIGTKATDWTPAPEDVNTLVTDSIKIVDSKISDVSSNVTQLRDSVTTQINSINSKTHSIETNLGGKASKQEVTEVNNRVATIKASVDSITQRVSSTESKTKTLETTINGKASKQEVNNVSSKVVSLEANLNGITNRVSSTESRINSLNGQVQNAATKQEFTEFKQTSKNFQAKVEEGNGGNNLIVNSGFHGLEGFFQTEYKWNGVNSSVNIWGDSSEWVMNGTNALVIRGTNGSHGAYGVKQEGIKLKPNATYTLSGYAAAHRGKWRISLAKNNWEWLASSRGNSMGGKNPDKWDRFVITFKTPSNYSDLTSCKIELMLEEAQNDSYAFFSNIMLNEGNFALPWQPKSYEIYGNTMIVDADKLKCSFEDNSYVQMGRNGFEWWKNGMAHPYHCLVTQGVINHLSFNGGNYHHRVYLPPEFRGKHFMVQTMIQGWNFPSGSVSGTMASGYQDVDYANGQFTIYFNGGGDWKTNCNIAYVVIA